MSTTELLTGTGQNVRPSRRRRPQRGWIGIDLGGRAIKLAQIEDNGFDYRIAARWTLCDECSPVLSREEIVGTGLRGRFSSIKKLRRAFAGKSCAAVLPMSLVDFRSFEIPSGNHRERREMIAQEFSADLNREPDELSFDFWEDANSGNPSAGSTRVTGIAVPKNLAEQLAAHLLKTGLECRALNGMPCALARGVELADPLQVEEAVAAVDLGYTSPLLVLVKGGRPVFSRTLRGGSLQSMMEPLQASLRISSEECRQLLIRFGVPIAGQSPRIAAQSTMQLIANPLQVLVSELERTVDYIGQQFRALMPRRLWLFGGGALVKNLPEFLGDKLQIPIAPWTLNAGGSDPSDALYGVAAALSSLSWEAGTCI